MANVGSQAKSIQTRNGNIDHHPSIYEPNKNHQRSWIRNLSFTRGHIWFGKRNKYTIPNLDQFHHTGFCINPPIESGCGMRIGLWHLFMWWTWVMMPRFYPGTIGNSQLIPGTQYYLDLSEVAWKAFILERVILHVLCVYIYDMCIYFIMCVYKWFTCTWW